MPKPKSIFTGEFCGTCGRPQEEGHTSEKCIHCGQRLIKPAYLNPEPRLADGTLISDIETETDTPDETDTSDETDTPDETDTSDETDTPDEKPRGRKRKADSED